jgi:hypothetical protein
LRVAAAQPLPSQKPCCRCQLLRAGLSQLQLLLLKSQRLLKSKRRHLLKLD